MPIKLVVPTSLQIGWIESPPYFFTVSETRKYLTEKYTENLVESLALHKILKLTEVNPDFAELPKIYISNEPFNYMLEVYMYDYIELAILRSQDQPHNFANAIMTGIHDVFPPEKYDKEDAISLKKILKRKPHAQLLGMCCNLNLMETQGRIPYSSLRTAITIFEQNCKMY